ncbi:MAG: DNA integrity scanning protein DisA nucleotide-binding domain protein [Acidobacteriia bacterium]|nr:DNA integrity scanning protein DisA nucleotide-binding domain protein [Terriglobia bacterium]
MSQEVAGELFELFNQIALLRYEEAASNGFLMLCPPTGVPPVLALKLESPFDITDIRGVRKMLQISDEQLCVLCDGRMVLGFVAMNADHTDTLMIQFRGHGVWEVRQGGCTIAQIDATEGELLALGLSEQHFLSVVQQAFEGLPEPRAQHLWTLVAAAQRQLRGTNVLITEHAAAEARRMESQCTRIEPVALTPLLMSRLTGIDGTVVIDTNGICHAIGAILDGPVSARGDRRRGGRYNSALMYVDHSRFPSLIVVVSQDGMVDLVHREKEYPRE